MEVALLSELGFKHQETTARGEGREAGEGVHEGPGCPEDRKWDGGRPGGRGVVRWRVGDGGEGDDKGRLLGEEAEKTVKGQRHGENLALWAAPAKLQHLAANMASLFDFGAFLSEWGLPVVKALGDEGYYSHRRGHSRLQ